MNFTQPGFISLLVFLITIASVIIAILLGVYSSNLRLKGPAIHRTFLVGLGLLIWVGAISAVVESGTLQENLMPGIPLFFGIINLASILFALSPPGKWLALGLPIPFLVGFQAFRFPLELVLHSWAESGTIPSSMTWTGQNYDIITGFAAIFLAPLSGRSKEVAWIFNILGFGLLLNVGRVAIFSSPLPFGWDVSPPLMLGLYLPYAWIAPVCVGGALAGHVVLTRALLTQKR